jgi:plasmid maintenance system antidote protein VapI
MYDGVVSDEPCDTPWQMWSEEQWQRWEADGSCWPLQPEWTVPPAEMLIEWAEEHGMAPDGLRMYLKTSAVELLDLLDDPPAVLTPEKAEQLETVTGIPARLWMRFEAFYRADMARAAKTAEMRAALGPAVSPGEMLKQWADEHDPRHEQLRALFFGEDNPEEKVRAILTNRHKLTPDDVLLLAAQTDIAAAVWADQERAYWEWMSQWEAASTHAAQGRD